MPTVLVNLADMALSDGDTTRALALYAESLSQQRELHDTFHIVFDPARDRGNLAGPGEDGGSGPGFLGADRLRGNMGRLVFAGERIWSDEMNDRLQMALSEERFAMAWDADTRSR